MPYDAHHTLIETKEERMKRGKNVDDGTNMVAGVGGLTSFGDMVQGAYQDMYSGLIEGEAKKMIGAKKSSGGSGGAKCTVSAMSLIGTPNKFATGGKRK